MRTPEQKAVHAARQRKYRRDNPGKAAGTARRYREAHREHARRKTKEWRAENPERSRAGREAWVAANPTKVAAYKERYRQKNKHKWAAMASKRRAQQLLATPLWLTTDQHADIEAWYELGRAVGREVDHIVPLRGRTVRGLHVPWNLQLLPAAENRRKLNKLGAE